MDSFEDDESDSYSMHSVKNELDPDDKVNVNFFSLFKYADCADVAMLIIGTICAMLNGTSFPINLIIFSSVINSFTGADTSTTPLENMETNFKWYIILGCGVYVTSFIQTFCFSLSSKRQTTRIRLLLFKQILRQDVSWFDGQSTGNIVAKLSSSVDQIQTGIGDKLGRFIQFMVMGLACFISAFSNQWKLALIGLAGTPLIAFAFAIMGFSLRSFSQKEIVAYSDANVIAGEVLSSIKTVFAFIGQSKESVRYRSKLGLAAKQSFKKNGILGFGIGFISFSIYSSVGLTFWYGVKLLTEGDEEVEAGKIFSVVLAFLVGSISLGLILPEFGYFATAQSAAGETFGIIERTPTIDKDHVGIKIQDLNGELEFKNVTFAYPMRPESITLNNFSLKVESGSTIAIVGASGSGKSTAVQLLQRFYDPLSGNLYIDGLNIRYLDLHWYRSQLGVVSQEPVLFSGTVAENIALGKDDATLEEIVEASKLADAHNFISDLPDAYDTLIAEGGGGMSGGQKQRIAIARALVRNPRILLLDEATSALDTRSERLVQNALNRARVGRTVIMIAHRLTTVKDADKIIVMDHGEVKEFGTHAELIELNKLYAQMLSTQRKVDDSDDEDDDKLETNRSSIMLSKEELLKQNVWIKSKKPSDSESKISQVSLISDFYKAAKKHLLWRSLKMNKPEYCYLIFGLLFSLIGGLAQPAFTLLYSEMFLVVGMPNNISSKLYEAGFLGGMMSLLGVLRLGFVMASSLLLGYAGSKLTKRMRSLLFDAFLKQETGWFDETTNQPGILTARLATEVSSLETITGLQLGAVLEACCLLVASLVIAFMYSWQLTLINLCFMPIVAIAGAIHASHLKSSYEQKEVMGSQVVQEALSADRTVFSFGLESHFYEKFKEKISENSFSQYKEAILYSIVYGFASATSSFQNGTTFYVGAYFMSIKIADELAVFRTFSAFNFGAQGLVRLVSIVPELKKAVMKIQKVFETLDRQTKLDATKGLYPDEPFKGKIEFKKVYFRYPTRPNVKILRGFDHLVNPGETVAMVGQSGCGKSTLLQLVQRLYDVTSRGSDSGIFLDGMDVRELAPNWIRKQIGIVSQEPNLFNLSIRENIAYGDNSRDVSMDEIIEAAIKANVHEFIENLPEGYETLVGDRGSQLSGGQKQRVAIARAIIRQPKLLLLDEATSALDNESEKVVQTALDSLTDKDEQTCLVVAHRLTTVENSDIIVVLQSGQKVESGPPTALMRAKGLYFALHNVDFTVKK